MPDPNSNPWGSWGGSGGGPQQQGQGSPWANFFSGFMPSQNAMGAMQQYGMGGLSDATQERAAPGTTSFSGMPVSDLANLDRVNAVYNSSYTNPWSAPLVAGGLSAYELAKYGAQNIPGGIPLWNATVGQVPSGEDVSSLALNQTSSPASASNITSVLTAAAGGIGDRLGLSNYGMPNFSDVQGGASTAPSASSAPSSNFSDVTSGASTSQPPPNFSTSIDVTAPASPESTGVGPSQSVLETAKRVGLGNLYDLVAQERSDPGSTELAGISTTDLASLDRLGEFYGRAQGVGPAATLGMAAAIPSYEAAKGIAQNIPGGQSLWNAGVNAVNAVNPNPMGIPINELTMDNSTSPAGMPNVISGLTGLASGVADRYLGTNFGSAAGPSTNNMPTGQDFNTLVPNPNAASAPAPGSIDFGPGTHAGESGGTPPSTAASSAPTTDPSQTADQSGNPLNNVSTDPAIAAQQNANWFGMNRANWQNYAMDQWQKQQQLMNSYQPQNSYGLSPTGGAWLGQG